MDAEVGMENLLHGRIVKRRQGHFAASAQLGEMTLYDDFHGKWVHPDKWDGGTGRADMKTVWCMTGDGYLETGLRGFSSIEEDGVRQRHRNSLFMNEEVAGAVNSIGVEAMVD